MEGNIAEDLQKRPTPKASRSARWKDRLSFNSKFGQKSRLNPSTSQTQALTSEPSESGASVISAPSEEANELGPIRALWNEAYEELKNKNSDLATRYEAQLRESVHGMIASTAVGGVGKQELMKSVVDMKLQQYKDDTWKVKALGEEFLVKDMTKPLIGVIKWADKYVGQALKANPMASIGWAGVMVFVPVRVYFPRACMTQNWQT